MRKRAAIELFARHEETLRRTARRYSLCADDVDDALQRALEIVLTKAPTDNPRELIRWTQTVTKHEALAVRRDRERLLPPSLPGREEIGEDWVATIPTESAGPAERAERRETIARSREALQALKPQELRTLTLLGEGYSYAEIGEITGFSPTKINRCLAEGRERFRKLILRTEDGRRCAELRPLLSAFSDGEAGADEVVALREHLRACSGCRATLRAYRAAPHAAAALAPLPLSRSLFERAHEAFAGLSSRLPGQGSGTDSTLSQVAATGGARGAGMTALAKLLAVCAGTAGGAAACVATGVVPAPVELPRRQVEAPAIQRELDRVTVAAWSESGVQYEPAPAPPQPEQPKPESKQETAPQPAQVSEPPAAPETSAGAVEYVPESPVVSSPPPSSSSPSAGDASGEFGP
ncbi:MAG TPA: sigma-70 family RNA polymerase sigma factor [Solirubrobacterales bacterium]|nr:sigma-70 family RNA polymerase sigma factor [Solirubrobacterales bacterium]